MEEAETTEEYSADIEINSDPVEAGFDHGLAPEVAEFQFSSVEEIVQTLDQEKWEKTAASAGGDYLKRDGQEWVYKEGPGKETSITAQVMGTEVGQRHTQILEGLYSSGFAVSEYTQADKVMREVYFADEKGRVSFDAYSRAIEAHEESDLPEDSVSFLSLAQEQAAGKQPQAPSETTIVIDLNQALAPERTAGSEHAAHESNQDQEVVTLQPDNAEYPIFTQRMVLQPTAQELPANSETAVIAKSESLVAIDEIEATGISLIFDNEASNDVVPAKVVDQVPPLAVTLETNMMARSEPVGAVVEVIAEHQEEPAIEKLVEATEQASGISIEPALAEPAAVQQIEIPQPQESEVADEISIESKPAGAPTEQMDLGLAAEPEFTEPLPAAQLPDAETVFQAQPLESIQTFVVNFEQHSEPEPEEMKSEAKLETALEPVIKDPRPVDIIAIAPAEQIIKEAIEPAHIPETTIEPLRRVESKQENTIVSPTTIEPLEQPEARIILSEPTVVDSEIVMAIAESVQVTQIVQPVESKAAERLAIDAPASAVLETQPAAEPAVTDLLADLGRADSAPRATSGIVSRTTHEPVRLESFRRVLMPIDRPQARINIHSEPLARLIEIKPVLVPFRDFEQTKTVIRQELRVASASSVISAPQRQSSTSELVKPASTLARPERIQSAPAPEFRVIQAADRQFQSRESILIPESKQKPVEARVTDISEMLAQRAPVRQAALPVERIISKPSPTARPIIRPAAEEPQPRSESVIEAQSLNRVIFNARRQSEPIIESPVIRFNNEQAVRKDAAKPEQLNRSGQTGNSNFNEVVIDETEPELIAQAA